MGAIHVDITIGTVTRPTIFMVINVRPSYNLLVGRGWLHGLGIVPSSMHQHLVIRRVDDTIGNIEWEQGYFMADVNNVVKKEFERELANIYPGLPTEDVYYNLNEAFVSLKLHETDHFTWDLERLED